MQTQMGGMRTQINEIDKKVDGLDTKVNEIDKKVDGLDTRVNEIDKKVDGLDTRVSGIELHLENVTDRNIGLLMEQHGPNADRLNTVINQIEAIQFDVDGLKKVVISHSKDLNILMKR